MKTIWKFRLEPGGDFFAPAGARILSVQMQSGTPHMWVMVDTEAEKEYVPVTVYGTGHPVPDEPGRFVNTFQTPDGLVFHVFQPQS